MWGNQLGGDEKSRQLGQEAGREKEPQGLQTGRRAREMSWFWGRLKQRHKAGIHLCRLQDMHSGQMSLTLRMESRIWKVQAFACAGLKLR